MARYKVKHDLDATWIGLDEAGNWAWLPWDKAYKFHNYFNAKVALGSLPDEKRSYGFSYKPYFMKVERTLEEQVALDQGFYSYSTFDRSAEAQAIADRLSNYPISLV